MRVLLCLVGVFVVVGCQPAESLPQPREPVSSQPKPPTPPYMAGAWGGFTPDGKLLLTHYASPGGSPIPGDWKLGTLWEVPSGKFVRYLRKEDWEFFLAILPDGKMALSQASGQLRYWDLGRGEVVRTVDLPPSYGRFLALAPDGKRLLYAGGKQYQQEPHLWDLEAGKVTRYEPTGLCVGTARFSPDGLKALFGCIPGPDFPLVLWDVERGKVIRSFPSGRKWGTPAEFSPGGKFATAVEQWGIDRNARPRWKMVFWEADTGEVVRRFEGVGYGRASWTAFSPDGKHLISVDHDGTMRRHEVARGKLVWSVELDHRVLDNFVFTKDRTLGLAVCGTLGRPEGMALTLWDTVRGEKLRELSSGVE